MECDGEEKKEDDAQAKDDRLSLRRKGKQAECNAWRDASADDGIIMRKTTIFSPVESEGETGLSADEKAGRDDDALLFLSFSCSSCQKAGQMTTEEEAVT